MKTEDGGGGSRDFLDTLLPLIENLWHSPAQEAVRTGQGYLEPCDDYRGR